MIKMAIKTNIYPLGGYLDNVKITKMDVYKRMNEGMFVFEGWIERCENGKENKIYRVRIRHTILTKTGAPVIAFRLILNEDNDIEGYGADFESAYNGLLRQIRKQEALSRFIKISTILINSKQH
mgnify:CR=1 FL=1